MTGVVYTDVARPGDELLKAYRTLSVATIHEALGKQGLLDCGIRPIREGQHVAGPAVTAVMSPGDNLALHVAIHYARPGDVLVAAFEEYASYGVFGELVATLCSARGLAGVVLDTGCRDSDLIRDIGLPVWSRVVTAQGTVKEDLVGVNTPVVCAGVRVNPGDIVVADGDGVVVVPSASAQDVVEAAHKRDLREEGIRQAYKAGTTSYTFHRMDRTLAADGVVTHQGIYGQP